MQEIKGLVSVIIPAYNAAAFLEETIQSVKSQSISSWQLIVVNDGSVDETSAVAKRQADKRIFLIEQENAGVSAARNKGFDQASGEFVVFLDADDVLTPSFMELRMKVLQQDETVGFVGGWVETFPVASPLKKGAGLDPQNEILFFDPAVATVPSNYMIRREAMIKNGVRFNPRLNSAADRFFLVQLTHHVRAAIIPASDGRLMYRISEKSMSHNVSEKLIRDKINFYTELKKGNLLPVGRKQKFKSKLFLSVALSFAKMKKYGLGFDYFFRSFIAQPFVFCQSMIKRFQR